MPAEELMVEAAKQHSVQNDLPGKGVVESELESAGPLGPTRSHGILAQVSATFNAERAFASWNSGIRSALAALECKALLSDKDIGFERELSLVVKPDGAVGFIHWVDVKENRGKEVTVDASTYEVKPFCNIIHPTEHFDGITVLVPAVGCRLVQQKFKKRWTTIELDDGATVDVDEMPKVSPDVMALKQLYSLASGDGRSNLSGVCQCFVCGAGSLRASALSTCAMCKLAAHADCAEVASDRFRERPGGFGLGDFEHVAVPSDLPRSAL